MEKVLVLDESGVLNASIEKEPFFIIGGILYDKNDFDLIKSKIVPFFNILNEIYETDEIKTRKLSNNNRGNLVKGSILGFIRDLKEIKSVILVVDKKHTYKLDTYNTLSFKYNFLISQLLKDMIQKKLIDPKDKVDVLFDNYSFSSQDEDNFKNWMKENVDCVAYTDILDSVQYKFIQLADIIAGIAKISNKDQLNHENLSKRDSIQILSPDYIDVFPRSQSHKIL